MRPRSELALAALLAAAGAGAQPTPPKGTPPPPPPPSAIAQDYADLVRLGIIDPKSGSSESLDAELAAGEAALERGDHSTAAARFYAIVESPRYADYEPSVAFQNAEYALVVGLALGGAYDEALGYVTRILRRGPKAQYFAVAHRRAVDIALESRHYAEVLARLEAVPLGEPLPVEAQGERVYLVGRAAYESGDFDAAEKQLAQISRKSRLFTSSIYIRGVIRVRQGKLKEAVDVFCEITHVTDDDKYTFYVDDRYFGLKDLAQLASGRIAHEDKRFDDAYYHYFQVPDDSDRLPEALFEASWSMYQKRELRTARDLNGEFLKNFPTSPLAPEAMLLAGYIELADCKFEESRKRFDALAADIRPLVDAIEKAKKDVEQRKQMLGKALARASRRGPNANPPPLANTPEDRILGMLRLDPPLVRLNETVVGLQKEAQVAPHVIDEWRNLSYRIASRTGQVAGSNDEAARATLLLAEIRGLREDIRREKTAVASGAAPAPESREQLDKADNDLAILEDKTLTSAVLGSPDADPQLRAKLEAEIGGTQKLADRSRALADGWDRTIDRVAVRELDRAETDLVRIYEKARLGKIDAVIGEKRIIEKEIEDIAGDNYLPRSVGRVFRLGLISDTEEYWPPEEEVWDDEYEGFR